MANNKKEMAKISTIEGILECKKGTKKVNGETRKTLKLELDITDYENGAELPESKSGRTYSVLHSSSFKSIDVDEVLRLSFNLNANKKGYDEKRAPKSEDNTKAKKELETAKKENESLKSEMDELKAQMAEMMKMMKANAK